jgi:hypothetical protein
MDAHLRDRLYKNICDTVCILFYGISYQTFLEIRNERRLVNSRPKVKSRQELQILKINDCDIL